MADPRSQPSMEEILASIKRIIADEPGPVSGLSSQPVSPPPPLPPAGQAATPPPPRWSSATGRELPPSPASPVLELTDLAPEAAPPAPEQYLAEPPVVQQAPERPEQAQPAAPRPVPRDLLPRTPAPRSSGGDVTLEALVRDMLEPMLADWMDRNLPEIVERVVQAEIRRMSDPE